MYLTTFVQVEQVDQDHLMIDAIPSFGQRLVGPSYEGV